MYDESYGKDLTGANLSPANLTRAVGPDLTGAILE